ncbi:MAG TPA: hypothetical protein VI756_31575 [Blastocatellia bacterium]
MMREDKTPESATDASSTRDGRSLATSRRQFAKTMAVIAASPLLPGLSPTHAASPTGKISLAEETMNDTIFLDTYNSSEGQAQDAEKPTPDAEALAEVVRIRYGKYLSDDQMAEVRRSVNQRVRGADRLKQFKLANGDEPAFVFSPDPD